MKALVSWLRDLVEIPDGVSIDALAHALHMSGFELAGIEPVEGWRAATMRCSTSKSPRTGPIPSA